MTIKELTNLLADFRRRTPTLRGRPTKYATIDIAEDEAAMLTVHLEPARGPGSVISEIRGPASVVHCFCDHWQDAVSVLSGRSEGDWLYDDEA